MGLAEGGGSCVCTCLRLIKRLLGGVITLLDGAYARHERVHVTDS